MSIAYFGTEQRLAKQQQLRAGKLTAQYEQGSLRYVCWEDQEVLRMLYAAVRDENWLTVPYQITDESIQTHSDAFLITYTAHYEQAGIRYRAKMHIEGKSDHTITFAMQGEALSDFQRNRIGLCVHHPIRECAGQPIRIVQPDEKVYESHFPTPISPHQPFTNVQQMHWSVLGAEAELHFSGEVFETEDQRNWTDHSYKTYGTPLEQPFPVLVAAGDTLTQQARLVVRPSTSADSDTNAQKSVSPTSELTYAFPQIGYSRAVDQTLTDEAVAQLRALPFDHYRVEVRLSESWQETLKRALHEAAALNTSLELVVFFGDDAAGQTEELFSALSLDNKVSSLLVLHERSKTTPKALIEEVYPRLKQALPTLKVGYGTDAYFAELNRNRPATNAYDFVSYSINPQVHASDARSLIENLAAQADTIRTARAFAPGKEVHVSPVTLKPRYNPNATGESSSFSADALPSNIDPRQASELLAAWTLLSLRYLADADRVTLYETVGMRGLMPDDATHPLFPTPDQAPFPVYDALRQLHQFRPINVIDRLFPDPLREDGLVVENEAGERQMLLINFIEESWNVIAEAH